MTYDMFIYPTNEATQRSQGGTYSFAGVRTRKSAGFQKMINKWAKCFLTLQGSDPGDLNYGTLYSSLSAGTTTDPALIDDIVRTSVSDASNQLTEIDNLNSPTTEERFFSATITDLVISNGSVSLTVLLRNEARKEAVVVLPSGELV